MVRTVWHWVGMAATLWVAFVVLLLALYDSGLRASIYEVLNGSEYCTRHYDAAVSGVTCKRNAFERGVVNYPLGASRTYIASLRSTFGVHTMFAIVNNFTIVTSWMVTLIALVYVLQLAMRFFFARLPLRRISVNMGTVASTIRGSSK